MKKAILEKLMKLFFTYNLELGVLEIRLSNIVERTHLVNFMAYCYRPYDKDPVQSLIIAEKVNLG